MSSWERLELNSDPDVIINLIMFLDKSGSMRPIWSTTLEGVVEYFEGLIEQPNVKYNASLHCFADKTTTVFDNVKLADVDTASIRNIKADGVSTALYDTLGSELRKLPESEAAHLVVVFTDGQDNSSSSQKASDIAELRKSLEDKGNFTFVFMGASPDVWQEAGATASQANTRIFTKSVASASAQFNSLRSATNSYGSTMSMNCSTKTRSVSKFFSDEDEQEALKVLTDTNVFNK